MALNVGTIEAVARVRVDERGLKSFRTSVDRARRDVRHPIEAKVGVKQDRSDFTRASRSIRELHSDARKPVDVKVGANVNHREMRNAEQSVHRLRGGLGQLGLAAGAAAAAFAGFTFLRQAAKETTELAVNTRRLTVATGLDSEASSAWVGLAEIRGVKTRQLQMSFTRLSTNMRSATEGSKRSVQAFKDLGVSMDSVKAGDTSAVITQVADGLHKMKNPADRAAIATVLFGRAGSRLLPILAQGSGAIAKNREELRKHGLILDDAGVKKGVKAAAAFRNFDEAMKGLRVTIGTAVLPVLARAADHLAKFWDDMRAGKGTAGEVGKTLTTIGKAALGVAKAMAPVIAAVAKFLGQHPGLAKVVGTIAAIGIALRTLKFASAITGVSTFARALRGLGGAGLAGARAAASGLGAFSRFAGPRVSAALRWLATRFAATTAGGRAVSAIASGIGGFPRAAAGAVRRALAWLAARFAATRAGAAAADAITSVMSSNIAASIRGGRLAGVAGRFRGLGKTAGTGFAVAFGAALLAYFTTEVLPDLEKAVDQAIHGKKKGERGPNIPVLGPMLNALLGGSGGGLTARGGFLHFQAGGPVPGAGTKDTVPAMLTPGEFVVPRPAVTAIGASTLSAVSRGASQAGKLAGAVAGSFGALPAAAVKSGTATTAGLTKALAAGERPTKQAAEKVRKAYLDQTTRMRKDSEKDGKAVRDDWGKRLDESRKATDTDGKAIGTRLKAHVDYAARATKAAGGRISGEMSSHMTAARRSAERGGQAIRSSVSSNLGAAAATAKSRGAQLSAAVRASMQSADSATYSGMRYIGTATNQALTAFGAKPVSVSVSAPSRKASGSWVGRRGEKGGDTEVALLGRGEAVLNRHQQPHVEAALALANAVGASPFRSLDHLFAGVTRPHYLASGGRVRRFAGGGHMGVLPGMAVLADFLKRRFGLGLMSGLRPGAITTSGKPSDHGWGGAIDVSNGVTTPQEDAAHAWLSHHMGAAIKQMLYRTMIGGNHFNHIHVALLPRFARSAELVSKLVGGTFGKVKMPKVEGRGSATKVVKAALTKVRAAAQKKVDAEAARYTDTGPSGEAGLPLGPGWHRTTASFFTDTGPGASGHLMQHPFSFAELSDPPGSHNWSALGHLPFGSRLEVDYGGRRIVVGKWDVGAGGGGLGGTKRTVDLWGPAKAALGMPDLAVVNIRGTTKPEGRSLARGGFLGGLARYARGKPKPRRRVSESHPIPPRRYESHPIPTARELAADPPYHTWESEIGASDIKIAAAEATPGTEDERALYLERRSLDSKRIAEIDRALRTLRLRYGQVRVAKAMGPAWVRGRLRRLRKQLKHVRDHGPKAPRPPKAPGRKASARVRRRYAEARRKYGFARRAYDHARRSWTGRMEHIKGAMRPWTISPAGLAAQRKALEDEKKSVIDDRQTMRDKTGEVQSPEEPEGWLLPGEVKELDRYQTQLSVAGLDTPFDETMTAPDDLAHPNPRHPLADDEAAAGRIYGLWMRVLARVRAGKPTGPALRAVIETFTGARDAWQEVHNQRFGLSGTGSEADQVAKRVADALAAFNAQRTELMGSFGSNIVGAGTSPQVPAGLGRYWGGVPGGVGGGGSPTNVTINQHWKMEQPPDPATYSRSLAWEARAAI